jgi:hypothetical protein
MTKMKLVKQIKIIILLLTFVTALVIVFIRVSVLLTKDNSKFINSEIISSLSKSYFTSQNSQGEKIILFLDFSDFGCLPCSTGVSDICKKLKESENIDVMVLIRKRKGTDEYYSWLAENWRKENDIEFPIVLDKNKVFEQANISKTSIAVLDKVQRVIEYKEFPMPIKEMSELIEEINKSPDKSGIKININQ